MNRPELASGHLKSREGEPVFGEPWHAQAIAMADLLVRSGRISGNEWAETLGAEIRVLEAAQTPDNRESYFRAVLAALVRLLAEDGSVRSEELAEREGQWERAYLRTPHGQPVELDGGG